MAIPSRLPPFLPLALRASAALAAALLPVGAAASPVAPAEIKAARATLEELVEFLRLPNVASKSGADMRANAAWLEARLKAHGFYFCYHLNYLIKLFKYAGACRLGINFYKATG